MDRIFYWINDENGPELLEGALRKEGWEVIWQQYDWEDAAKNILRDHATGKIVAVAIDIVFDTNEVSAIKWHEKIFQDIGIDLKSYEEIIEHRRRNGYAMAILCMTTGIYSAFNTAFAPPLNSPAGRIIIEKIGKRVKSWPDMFDPELSNKISAEINIPLWIDWINSHPFLDPFGGLKRKLELMKFASDQGDVPHTFGIDRFSKSEELNRNAEKLRRIVIQQLGELGIGDEYNEILHETLKRWFGNWKDDYQCLKSNWKHENYNFLDWKWLGAKLKGKKNLRITLKDMNVQKSFSLNITCDPEMVTLNNMTMSDWSDLYANWANEITAKSDTDDVNLEVLENSAGDIQLMLKWESILDRDSFNEFKRKFLYKMRNNGDIEGEASKALLKLYECWSFKNYDIMRGLIWNNGDIPEKDSWSDLKDEKLFIISFVFKGGSIHYPAGVLI